MSWLSDSWVPLLGAVGTVTGSVAMLLSVRAMSKSNKAQRELVDLTRQQTEYQRAQTLITAVSAVADAASDAIAKLQQKGQNKVAHRMAMVLAKMNREIDLRGMDAVEDARDDLARLLGPRWSKELGFEYPRTPAKKVQS